MKCLCCCARNSNSSNENDTFAHNSLTSISYVSTSIEKIQRTTPPAWELPIYDTVATLMNPQAYIDSTNKEWLCFLAREDITNLESNIISSYLYDIKNDQYIPFIKNYKVELEMVERIHSNKHKINNNYVFGNYIIDHLNDMMYLLECRNGLMIKISISNLQNIKVIDSIFVEDQLPMLTNYHFKMILSNHGKLIHILLTCLNLSNTKQHFIFNTQTGICKFIEDYIGKIQSPVFLKNYDRVTGRQKKFIQEKRQHKFEKNDDYNNTNIGLEIGDMIDARTSSRDGTWFLAKIIDITPKNNTDKTVLSTVEKWKNKKGILVEYQHQGNNEHYYKQSEWIYINDENKYLLCDCIGACYVSQKYHRIAPAKTQTLIPKDLGSLSIGLDHTKVYNDDRKHQIKIFKLFLQANWYFGYQIYCRNNCMDNYSNELLVYGYTRRISDNYKKWKIDIPVELCNIIANYCDIGQWYADNYRIEDKSWRTDVRMSSKIWFVYLDIDEYDLMIIFDAKNGIYALDLSCNVLFTITKENKIFDKPDKQSTVSRTYNRYCENYAVVSKQSRQIHIFVHGEYFSISLDQIINCLFVKRNHPNAVGYKYFKTDKLTVD